MEDHAEGRLHCKAPQGACNGSSPQLSRAAARRPACEQTESGATRLAGSFRPQAFG
jgi:hypothetical protein